VTLPLLEALRRGLTEDGASTEPGARDERLRGRTYAIPFDVVWRAAVALVDGGLRGWSLVGADDQDGYIEGMIRGRFRRFDSAVLIRIRLDRDAQTRVDAGSAIPGGRPDLGVGAHRLGRFFRALDHALEAEHGWSLSRARLEPAPWK
jgi:hypothetical protein